MKYWVFLTLWRIADWGGVGICVATIALSPWTTARAARKHLVHPAILRLHLLELGDVLETVDSATKIYLPHRWVWLIPVLAAVQRPFTEEGRIPLATISSLLCMNPWNTKYRLLLVQPFESLKASAINHSKKPISHTLRTVVADLPFALWTATNSRWILCRHNCASNSKISGKI